MPEPKAECGSSRSSSESELGRHDYWETAYGLELKNLEEAGDEGEVWFGKSTLKTMVEWTDSLLQERIADSRQAAVLDIGTGNGLFLCGLREKGYADLTGSDYSAAGIALAAAVAARRKFRDIAWVHDDLLRSNLKRRYDMVTDKGTLDAIGLSEKPREKRRHYRMAVWHLLRPCGLLVITSCNSTSEELQCRIHNELAKHISPAIT